MKKQSLFQRLMQKNYVIFIFALVISLVIWIYMSFNSTSVNTTFTIRDIPIQMELSEESRDLGLQVFPSGEAKASVTVSGNRTVLGLLNENDITVTAAAGSINSPDSNVTLPVSATKRSSRSNFEINSVSPTSITVTVDYYKESDFQIQDGVVFYLEDGYYGSTSLSVNSVKISGQLSKSVEADAALHLYDENNNELSQKMLNLSVESVKASVTVLPEKTVPVEAAFQNKPEGLEITNDMITITPPEIQLAGPTDTIDKLKSVKLEPIDFAGIKNEKIDFDNLGIVIPESCKSINNYTTAKVTLDLSQLSSKTFTVDKFVVEGLSDQYTYKVTSKSIDVTVIGYKDDLDKMTAKQITAAIAPMLSRTLLFVNRLIISIATATAIER